MYEMCYYYYTLSVWGAGGEKYLTAEWRRVDVCTRTRGTAGKKCEGTNVGLVRYGSRFLFFKREARLTTA